MLLGGGCGFGAKIADKSGQIPMQSAIFHRDEASKRVQTLAREISGTEPLESEVLGPFPCSGARRSDQEFYEVNWVVHGDPSQLDPFADDLEEKLTGYERHKLPKDDPPEWLFANGSEELTVTYYDSSGLIAFAAVTTCGTAE